MSRPLILLLLLLSPFAGAQQAEEEKPLPSRESSGETSTQAPATAATTAPASTSPAPSDESPFDYQSSEQISEDLSVSFPVDI